MATEFEIRDEFPIDAERFWKEVFFDEGFNHGLYVEQLGFPLWRLEEQRTDPDGTIHRVVRIEPKAEAPAALRKLVGDSIQYVERGSWSPSEGRYRFTIEPNKLSEKFETSGEIWTEPAGEGRIVRIARQRIAVKVFGVGKVIEGFLERETRRSFEVDARFTKQWIDERLS